MISPSRSLWAGYVFERLGIETLESERGFISFKVEGESLFVHEFYVKPEHRSSREAWNLYHAALDEAKARGCRRIIGCAWPGTKGAETAVSIALRCGFQLQPVKDGSVTYAKEIDHG